MSSFQENRTSTSARPGREFEKVYPMVPAGGSNDTVILGPEGDDEAARSGMAPS